MSSRDDDLRPSVAELFDLSPELDEHLAVIRENAPMDADERGRYLTELLARPPAARPDDGPSP